MAPIASPCNKSCAIDAVSGLCLGCGRNLLEIENWTGFTDQERVQVMAELPQRLAAISIRQPARAQML
jgi:predicted Fe-S protein YdhL (DUF1289 family)